MRECLSPTLKNLKAELDTLLYAKDILDTIIWYYNTNTGQFKIPDHLVKDLTAKIILYTKYDEGR
jgi:hypothetical protein